jgi:RimJ/RimL family protein N-acetyltransferase
VGSVGWTPMATDLETERLVLRLRENAPSLRVLEKLGFLRDHSIFDEHGEVVYLVRDVERTPG